MSLDLTKLQKVADLGDGVKRAQCPACAESGSDRTGQHLRIYPDGKFGCCVHPGNSEHRKRVYALAGDRARRGIKVRVAAAKSGEVIQSGVLGHLGRSFVSPGKPDAPDGVSEVESEIAEREGSRTQRTGEPNSNSDIENHEKDLRTARTGQTECIEEVCNYERTLRTPQLSLVLQQKSTEIEKYKTCIYKDIDEGVRCVRVQPGPVIKEKLPHLTPAGDLVIPFDSPERYHWWKGGQSIRRTKQELLERKENDASPF